MTVANWPVRNGGMDLSDAPRFFTVEEWATIEAATARIYPSGLGAGAREAKVVRFIDRYLSGVDHVFASAGGEGFLTIGGRDGDAWRQRIAKLQATYRQGIVRLDEISCTQFGKVFDGLSDGDQDRVLEIMSGIAKPDGIRVAEGGEAHVQNISDDGLDFFSVLVLHTRQGMFCDPIYGGNDGRVGWELIGFPGPRSLAETRDCSYGHPDKFLSHYDWAELIPHLRKGRQTDAGSHSRTKDK
jgi:gluconate 2-dehydrogenase gamma chain